MGKSAELSFLSCIIYELGVYLVNTTLLISFNDMLESVFKGLIQQSLISGIQVIEALPSKGKPAKKEVGSKSVWIVKSLYGDNQSDFLKSARGGPREWASLDNLSNWLRTCGVKEFKVKYASEYDRLPQQSFEFANTI